MGPNVIQEAIPHVPEFAPLFDKMTTHAISQRFTAEEALVFFQDRTDELSKETLLMPVELKMEDSQESYWDRLPSDVGRKWAHYRTPSVSST